MLIVLFGSCPSAEDRIRGILIAPKGSIEGKGIAPTTQVSGLSDSTNTPDEVTDEAGTLVGHGFCVLKLKVGMADFDELRLK